MTSERSKPRDFLSLIFISNIFLFFYKRLKFAKKVRRMEHGTKTPFFEEIAEKTA